MLSRRIILYFKLVQTFMNSTTLVQIEYMDSLFLVFSTLQGCQDLNIAYDYCHVIK